MTEPVKRTQSPGRDEARVPGRHDYERPGTTAIRQAGADDARRSRAQQGLPERVEDPAVAILAAILHEVPAPRPSGESSVSAAHNVSLALKRVVNLARYYQDQSNSRQGISVLGKFKILALTSDPTDAARLRLGKEMRVIREYLRASEHRERIELHERHATRPSDIVQAFFEVEPNIVHFSGHGTKYSELCFEDDSGKTHRIEPSAIQALFERFAGQVVCVVLNCCYSEVQAKAIAKSINYVVGMNDTVGDEAAIHFAGGFYRALGAGQTVEDAFQFGLVEVRLHGWKALNDKPVLVRNPTVMRQPMLIRPQTVMLPGDTPWSYYPEMPDCARIDLGRRDRAALYIDPDKYATFGEFIDELFVNYLSDRFPKFSYGSKWVLAAKPSARVAAPLEWAERAPCPLRELSTKQWKFRTTLEEQYVVPSSLWRVSPIGKGDGFYGVALKTEKLALAYQQWRIPKELISPPSLDILERVQFQDIDESQYPYRLVLQDNQRHSRSKKGRLGPPRGWGIWAETRPVPKEQLEFLIIDPALHKQSRH
jgi:hypothetical protein